MSRPWLRGLPKVELHVHLEGSLSVDTMARLAANHGVDLTTLWPGEVPRSFWGFRDFARNYQLGISLIRSAEDLAMVTDGLARSLADQNVRYAEVTSTAFLHLVGFREVPGMSTGEYSEGLDEGRRRAAGRGVAISWVVDIPRVLESPESTVTIDYLGSSRAPSGLVALGLSGHEAARSPDSYITHFERARALGLGAVPHAGETAGAESVRSCVVDLQASRVGHGIRCLEDHSVVDLLVEQNVLLEVCPTSNLRLGVVEAVGDHPLGLLRDAGLRVCLNTDDPGWFDTDLTSELELATERFGIDGTSHIEMQLDALAASFADRRLRRSVRQELGAWLADGSGRVVCEENKLPGGPISRAGERSPGMPNCSS